MCGGGDAWDRMAKHRTVLEVCEATPASERDWAVRGSIEYHQACIRHLDRMVRGMPAKLIMAPVKKRRNGK